MTRPDAATMLPALDSLEPETRRTLQALRGAPRVCPNTVLACGAAQDQPGTRWRVEERPILAFELETVRYRVTVAFSVSAEELEDIVEEHLGHPRSTDVRVEVVRGFPATATRP
jgi:hypothetical protein